MFTLKHPIKGNSQWHQGIDELISLTSFELDFKLRNRISGLCILTLRRTSKVPPPPWYGGGGGGVDGTPPLGFCCVSIFGEILPLVESL